MTEQLAVVVGAGPDCDLRLTSDEYVSTRHARIWRDDEARVWIEDLGSTNGTFVRRDGSATALRVWGPTRLYPGDWIQVGRTEIPWTP